MSDFNSQLERMKSLMTYGKIEETKAPSTHTLEYKKVAADGKTYGIIKECSKYYIKYNGDGKDTLAENYEYIGGINRKKDYEYTSYANALKNFEMKLASINEAHDAKVNIQTLDPFRREEVIAEASNKMKDEIARCRQIMYNASMLMNESTEIGATPIKNQPEAKHEHSGDKDAPFTDTVTPDMDFDGGKKTNCPKCAGEPYTKGGKCCDTKNDYTKVTEKDSVATASPKGGKVVRVNESIEDFDDEIEFDSEAKDAAEDDMDECGNLCEDEDEELLIDDEEEPKEEGPENECGNLYEEDLEDDPEDDEELEVVDDEEGEDMDDTEDMDDVENAEEDDMEGGEFDDEEEVDETDPESIRAEIERLQSLLDDMEGEEKEDDLEVVDDKDEDDEMDDEFDAEDEEAEDEEMGDEELEDDEMGDEDAEKEDTMKDLVNEVVSEILKEDTLHVFGQHPGYRKKPMELPETGADVTRHGRDWNDKSVHNEEPFGKEIGKGKPFDKVVDSITDTIIDNMKRNGILKKK